MNVILILLLIFIILLIFLLIRDGLHFINRTYRIRKYYPGPDILPLIGSAWEVLFLNSEETFKYPRYCAKKYKKSYRHLIDGKAVMNIIRATDIELLLSSPKYINKSEVYQFLHPFMGTGLLTSQGNKWQHRRRILTPAFHFNILQQFFVIFNEESNNFIELLKKDVNNSDGTKLQSYIARFTLNTICETAMGTKIDTMKEPDEYRKNIYEMGHLLIYRLMRPWIYSDWMYNLTRCRREFDKLLVPIHNFTRSVIKQRRQFFHENDLKINPVMNENIYETKKTRYAMLDTLLAAESNNEIDNEGIREEVDTFMFEGHDTTSSALVFTLLLIANHSDIQEEMYDEIKGLIDEKQGEPLQMNDYSNLKYMDRVIKETLRLYPPVPFISRQLTEDLIIDDVIFPSFVTFHIHIYDLHRDPEIFPNPELFDPDRFLPENIENRHPYAYIPFSAGPRNCIGQKFALLEMKTVLTSILKTFQLTPITKREDIVFVADMVLRAKHPIKVKFNLRENYMK